MALSLARRTAELVPMYAGHGATMLLNQVSRVPLCVCACMCACLCMDNVCVHVCLCVPVSSCLSCLHGCTCVLMLGYVRTCALELLVGLTDRGHGGM